jgi:mRNA interferase MazF
MARVLRGDIVWADLDLTQGHEQSGRRFVLVLSQDVFNERSGTVIACALTSQEPRAGFPLTLELSMLNPTEAILGQNQSNQNSFGETFGKTARPRFG